MTDKKRLLIATDNFLPRWDGIARFLIEIIPRLKKEYDITVLTSNFNGFYDDPTIKIIRLALRHFYIGDFPPAKPKKKIIKDAVKDSDIIWVQTIGPIGAKTIKIASKMNKKIIAYNHSIEWELVPNAIAGYIIKKPLYYLAKRHARKLYNKCNHLMVPTREVYEKLNRHKITSKKSIIPLGVDTDTFVPAGRKAAAKMAVGIDQNDFVIGYVGRIAREKDLKTLFRAFLRFLKVSQKSRLLIVGDGVESIKESLLKREEVILTGSKDNIIPYLHAMDVFVLPSLTETTSLSTLEAMSCGLPVIITPVGLAKENIKKGVNGYVINKGDTFSLYRNIVLINKDPLLGPKIGKAARITVIEKYSWKTTVEMIRETLDRL